MKRLLGWINKLLSAFAPKALAHASPMQKHDQLDVVSFSQDGWAVVLTLVETRPWDGNGTSLLDMQEKLKTYLNYVGSGQLYDQYPDAKGKKVRFRLDTVYAPDTQAEQFIEVVKDKWLAPESIEWEVSSLK